MTKVTHPETRGSIFMEQAEILQHTEYPAEQFVLKLAAEKIASQAEAGQFVHIQCDKQLPMRRPMSLMRVNARQGWIEILYKVHGAGTRLLSQHPAGHVLSIMGPIGKPFKLQNYAKRALLIGGGVGIPPMIYLSEHILATDNNCQPFVIMGSEVPFPFTPQPSKIIVPGIPEDVIATMPLLEDWKIPCRLASLQNFAGCYSGYVTDLARAWLQNQNRIDDIEIFSCGPTPMLKAVAALAQEFNLPCQISLEEYMACAVGGCAGCTVLVHEEQGEAMRRVCVDGPVFEANQIYPQL